MAEGSDQDDLLAVVGLRVQHRPPRLVADVAHPKHDDLGVEVLCLKARADHPDDISREGGAFPGYSPRATVSGTDIPVGPDFYRARA